MEENIKLEVITFYKQLRAKQIIESQRLEMYKCEHNAIEPSLEPQRALESNVRIQQQTEFLDKIRKIEKDTADQLYGFGKSCNDIEAMVFTMCIMQNRPSKEVARITDKADKTIRNIKTELMAQLNQITVNRQL